MARISGGRLLGRLLSVAGYASPRTSSIATENVPERLLQMSLQMSGGGTKDEKDSRYNQDRTMRAPAGGHRPGLGVPAVVCVLFVTLC